VALLGPFVLALGAMALHVVFGGQPPDLLAMVGVLPTVLALSVYMFIQVGIGEEIGWRGYALPKLQSGYSALVSSVILGVIWVLWHLPLFFNPATSYSNTPFWVFFVFLLPFPIVYTWIFNSTGGSVLMAMILHAVTNASTGPLWRATPEYSTAVSNTDVYLLQAAVLWVAAIVLVLVYGASNLSRKPRQVFGELRALLSEAGFRRVEIIAKSLDAHFLSPDRFVELTVLAGAAVVPTFDHEDSAARLALPEAVSREIEPVVQHYRSGDRLIVSTFWHIAVAYAS
jgi:membrane protease YdiL (CAAX protease family)